MPTKLGMLLVPQETTLPAKFQADRSVTSRDIDVLSPRGTSQRHISLKRSEGYQTLRSFDPPIDHSPREVSGRSDQPFKNYGHLKSVRHYTVSPPCQQYYGDTRADRPRDARAVRVCNASLF